MPVKSNWKNLTACERERLLGFLLSNYKDGKLRRGSIVEAATEFEKDKSVISRLWRTWLKKREEEGYWDVRSNKYLTGRRILYNKEDIKEELLNMPLDDRRTTRSIAGKLDVSQHTIHRAVKEKILKKKMQHVLPILTEQNRIHRLLYCVNEIYSVSDPANFCPMYDRVHLDEKWFYICEKKGKYYLVDEEKLPAKYVKNKLHLQKVMFVCAVARPRFLQDGTYWDGKLGIWPFAEEAPALRNSVNCPRGTIEFRTKNVTKNVFREFLFSKVIPSIIQKWPRMYDPTGNLVHHNIYVQQDNASVHILPREFDIIMQQIPSPELSIKA